MKRYDRYSKFRENGAIGIVPFIRIQEKDTDIYIEYDSRNMRLDLLSYKYYYDSGYGWLIMQANPQYGSMEFLIPDKAIVRIPYPLESTLDMYEQGVDEYFRINGITI